MRFAIVIVVLVGLVLLAGCPQKAETPPASAPATGAPAPTGSAPPSGGNAEAEKAAVAAADAWLKLMDEGKYEDGWAQMAEFARNAVEQAGFAKQMKTFRDPLGDLVSRKVMSSEYATSLPGAPDGEYVVIQYQTSFAKKQSAVETVTPMKDTDGSWRVSGYFIK